MNKSLKIIMTKKKKKNFISPHQFLSELPSLFQMTMDGFLRFNLFQWRYDIYRHHFFITFFVLFIYLQFNAYLVFVITRINWITKRIKSEQSKHQEAAFHIIQTWKIWKKKYSKSALFILKFIFSPQVQIIYKISPFHSISFSLNLFMLISTIFSFKYLCFSIFIHSQLVHILSL